MNAILNWNDADYQNIYLRQLRDASFYHDADAGVWVVYSYNLCEAVLSHPDLHIPPPSLMEANALSPKGLRLLNKMVRLQNGENHAAAHSAAMLVFNRLKQVPVAGVLQNLLKKISPLTGFDWVEVVAKQLPLRLILNGFEVSDDEADQLLTKISSLVALMSSNENNADFDSLNEAVSAFYWVAERCVNRIGPANGDPEMKAWLICNLVGLCIQSYDAGRGLLTNVLLDWAEHRQNPSAHWPEFVNETLRLHPPVHNTRRVAIKNVLIDGQLIKAGERVLIVLAAANLDEKVFADPLIFDPQRPNCNRHLTFGQGGHQCLARYFCVDVAAQVCAFLQENYPDLKITQRDFSYEPQLNVRLVKQLIVNFK